MKLILAVTTAITLFLLAADALSRWDKQRVFRVAGGVSIPVDETV